MTRNKMTDLNDHLFAQLERLGDEDLSGDDLDAEIRRAKAVQGVAQQVIANADVVLREGLRARMRQPATMPHVHRRWKKAASIARSLSRSATA